MLGQNLLNIFFKVNKNNSIIKKISSINFNLLNLIHTNNKNFSSSKESNDVKIDKPEFHRDVSSGLRNLEKLGVIKPYMSWPQYNRIIYPPTEDGKSLKNPVNRVLLYQRR
jgi:hypothetical protein